MEPKFDKRFIDEAVQEVVKDIKQNYIPKEVFNEMTREEAINQLKDFIILHREQHGWDISTLNALDMAIKALEQTKLEKCKDCVSKKDVIKAVYNWLEFYDPFEPNEPDLDDALGNLPPVEPERKTGEWKIYAMGGDMECSVCKKEFEKHELRFRNYCPNCGAKMFEKTHGVYEEFLKETIHDKD